MRQFKYSYHSHLCKVKKTFFRKVWSSFIYKREVRQIYSKIWNTWRITSEMFLK